MKILAASDIHGDSKLTKKLALQAEKENVDLSQNLPPANIYKSHFP